MHSSMRMNNRISFNSSMTCSVFIPLSHVSRSDANMFLATETDLPLFNSADPLQIAHRKELGALLITPTPYPLILAFDRALEKRDQAAQKDPCILVSLADLSERQGEEGDLHPIAS